MNEEGHVWQRSKGMALGCLDRLCTKCMRSDLVVAGEATEGTVIVVRYWGRVELKRDSAARQS
jgi:hypothetical protein